MATNLRKESANNPTKTHDSKDSDPGGLMDHSFAPMEAVDILYSHGKEDLSEAIIASLSRQIFDEKEPRPSTRLRRFLARGILRFLKRRTSVERRQGPDGQEMEVYRNRALERSDHPYAATLLSPSKASNATFVEGGDPMNAPYMMICPTISRNASTWDRLLLDNVLSCDVRLRFIWETRSTYEAARSRLDLGHPVRIMSAAAGTGLSAILVYDRLIRDGYAPDSIAVIMTDREESNVEKARRLLSKLATTRENLAHGGEQNGITSRTMDLTRTTSSQGVAEADGVYDVVTLVGILEYFRGFTSETTEEHLGEPYLTEESEGVDLIQKVAEMTAPSGKLIANTHRREPAAQILEVFGKKLRYRDRENLRALVETGGFIPVSTVGMANIFDVEVFERNSPASGRANRDPQAEEATP